MHEAPADRPAPPAVPFVAHRLTSGTPGPPLEPAPRWRDWMERQPDRWPVRCLPMLIANETGWVLRAPCEVRVTWDGGVGTEALSIEQERTTATSQFGTGIVTFDVPYHFRLPPGWDLLVRGPANEPRDGASALEGVVEADWAAAPFTMNWQLTRPGTVTFEAGAPFCQLVPMRRWDLEAMDPVWRPIGTPSELRDELQHHLTERRAAKLMKQAAAALGHRDVHWDGRYFRGRTPLGREAPEHRTKRRLRPFRSGD